MADTPASCYLATAFTGVAWTEAPHVAALARTQEPSLAELRAESELRDFVVRYADALDRGDVDQLVSLFTTDCVMTSQHGSFSGLAEIRAEYERMISDAPRRMHHFTNVQIRLGEGLDAAQVSSYVTAILESKTGFTHMVCGPVVVGLVHTSRGWQIARRWVSIDVSAPLPGGAQS